MTARISASVLCAAALALAGCAATVPGTAVRTAPGVDEDSRSPVDVDAVLLDRAELAAITGAGGNLTPIPGMDTKTPVDIDITEFLPEDVPLQCQWVFAETQVFGPDVEEFRKTAYQSPRDGGIVSQAAAGYRDHDTALRAFDSLTDRVNGCDATFSGPSLVGRLETTADSVQIRPGDCGRDYRVKSAVLVEVTFCAFPPSVPDILMTNILANVPD